MFRATGYELDGEHFSLDQIEHSSLRGESPAPFALRQTLPARDPRLDAAPGHADPRIHFALNCGAAPRPPISFYDEAGVDSQLDAAARTYLEAEAEIDPERGTVVLPGMMRLYRADFDVAGGPLEFALTRTCPRTRRRNSAPAPSCASNGRASTGR